MPSQHRLNEGVGAYVVVEFAGKDERHALYLASHATLGGLSWLVQSDKPIDRPKDSPVGQEVFEFRRKHYLAFPVSNASVAMLHELLPKLEPAFIGWRWVELARLLGELHAKGEAYQQNRPFSLRNLFFNGLSQVVPVPGAGREAGPHEYDAPEVPAQPPSPASDVYSLGASLTALVGGKPTAGPLPWWSPLSPVLRKATAAEPSKRYKDGRAFARALAMVLPLQRIAQIRTASRLFGSLIDMFDRFDDVMVRLAPLLLLILLAGGILLWQGFRLPANALQALAGAPAAGASPQPAARPGVVQPTAVPLPEGPLEFTAYRLQVESPCTAHLDLKVSKGRQPLPAEAPVALKVLVNGETVAAAQPPVDPAESGLVRLSFDQPALCASGGAIRVAATAGDASSALTLCYLGRRLAAADRSALAGLRPTAMEAAVQAYPDLTSTFTLADATGAAARFAGAVRCQVAQDGVDVPDFALAEVKSETDPVTVAVLVDVSGSMRDEQVAQARRLAAGLVRLLAPRSAACVYAIATTVRAVQPCTTDRRITLEAIDSIATGGNSALYDAVAAVAADHARLSGRQAIVVLSDGDDTASRLTLAAALDQIKRSNIPVYALGLITPDFRAAALQQMAGSSGGAYLEAPADVSGLYVRIQGPFRTQYALRFRSAFPDRTSGTVSLRLIDGNTTLESRHTYSVPAR